MSSDLKRYAGRLPYASELYGVHQPLLGWRSRLTALHFQPAVPRFADVQRVAVGGANDSLSIIFPNKQGVLISGGGNLLGLDGGPFKRLRLLPQPDPSPRFDTPAAFDSLLVRSLLDEVTLKRQGGLSPDDPTWENYWREVLTADALNERFQRILAGLQNGGFAVVEGPAGDPLRSYVQQVRTILGTDEAAYAHLFDHEISVAQFLNQAGAAALAPGQTLAAKMNGLFAAPAKDLSLGGVLAQNDPFALLPSGARELVLSPVGILHVFRQYFFELDNFLGPAVEHVWLAPGSKIDLYEVSTRRTLTEEILERSFESMLSSETSETREEELSEAMKSEDQSNTKLGSSVSGGASVLVVHAEASGSMSIEETQKKAREENHRSKRQQSTKLASQIRNSVKSTFRTVTETTDTRSKRYTIENTALPGGDPPRMRNYEMRRKMRQIAVQTQDVGSQLCWQVFVDDPGVNLGVAQLVHLAAKSDLSQYAANPPKTVPQPTTDVMTILCPVPPAGKTSHLGAIAASGFLGLMAGSVPGAAAGVAAYEVLHDLFGGGGGGDGYKIKVSTTIRQEYKIALPTGYEVAPAAEQDKGVDNLFATDGEIPLRHVQNGRNIACRMQIENAAEGRLLLVVNQGSVTTGEMMEFQVRLTIRPTAALIAQVQADNVAIAKDNEQKSAARDRVVKADFINAVRDRVTLASKIASRAPDDLREEERTVIYRALIQRLMADAWDADAPRESAHLRSEFIRSIFDVDKMFYAVAPEWWQPRRRASQEVGGHLPEKISATSALAVKNDLAMAEHHKSVIAQEKLGVLGALDAVGWGGEGRKDNYMITENSAPAKLGASLGWLLQLDGDNLRNSFLNAPWVKAVLPIRPGKEQQALEWLQQVKVEGNDGLDTPYAGDDLARFASRQPAGAGAPSVRGVLMMVASDIAEKNREALTPTEATSPLGQQVKGVLEPERVFQLGFDALKDGFRATNDRNHPFGIFDQWIEVLPTDQIVAVEVEYDPASGRMM